MTTWETGRFPAGFAEWNDRYRDAVRGFWLTASVTCGELARRIAGSSDLFRHAGRLPQASINFLTAHDGFTLADLVAYEHKHNQANGQNNQDGNNDNRSINCGVEGKSGDPPIRARRARLMRALLATLFVSQGVPMLPAGDDQGRTQDGNNNAYCQDNPLAWIDWDGADRELRSYCATLARLRRAHPALKRQLWFDGSPTVLGEPDVAWLARSGQPMSAADWDDQANRCFGFRLGRIDTAETALLVLLNGALQEVEFRLPPAPGAPWQLALDSSQLAAGIRDGMAHLPGEALLLLVSSPPHTADPQHG